MEQLQEQLVEEKVAKVKKEKAKVNLFELTQQGLQVKEMLDQFSDSDDKEIQFFLDEMETQFKLSLEEKAEQYYSVIQKFKFNASMYDAHINFLNEEIKKVKKAKESEEKKINNLKSRLKESLTALGMTNLKLKFGSFFIKKTTSVDDSAESIILEKAAENDKIKKYLFDVGILNTKTDIDFSKTQLKNIIEQISEKDSDYIFEEVKDIKEFLLSIKINENETLVIK